ncbi:MAG: DUF4114 domain-containing protein [Sphaerospermopsis sp. SIO1G2]|nr:DUF4114 domain-containing protein [Sphaerospermopsis sp. SIO1G2]
MGSVVADIVTSQVKADFVVHREAGYNNFVGFYQVIDENGGIDTNGDGNADILPGQSVYIQTAINSRLQDINLTVNNQGTETYSTILDPGSIVAPFIIIDEQPEAITDNNPNNDPPVYFPYIAANSDGSDHIRLLGNNVFGFEDLPNGGDQDFNDMIIQVQLTEM